MKIKIIDGVEYVRADEIEQEREERIKKAVECLSYSEKVAIKGIVKRLKGQDGVLKMGDIANENNFARSVIVNTLSKLAFAGTLESKSLGMKGTHIKILDKTLLEVLKEIE